jgi:hypothetical protein
MVIFITTTTTTSIPTSATPTPTITTISVMAYIPTSAIALTPNYIFSFKNHFRFTLERLALQR